MTWAGRMYVDELIGFAPVRKADILPGPDGAELPVKVFAVVP